MASTTYRIEKSFYNTFTTDIAITDNDRAYIRSRPESVYYMVKSQIQDPNLSFAPTSVKNLYLGNEG